MRLDRFPAPYLAQGPCARKQRPPSTNIFHSFSNLARCCLPRLFRGAEYLVGSFEIYLSLSVLGSK
jgi:hypothetical protein